MSIAGTTGVSEAEKRALEILEKIANQLEALNGAVSNLGEVAQQLVERKEVGAPEKPTKFDKPLRWTTFKTKQPCKKDEAGYAFVEDRYDPESSEELRKLVEGGRSLVEIEGVVWEIQIKGVFFNRNTPKVK